jgi:hypothetical protein
MPFVAILGAGELGGALTYTLASRAHFDEVRLIDPAGTVAVGKALDIRQAGPADGYSTRVSGHTDLAAAAGAWVVVLADLLATRDETRPRPDTVLAPVTRLAPGAVVVCADAAHGTLLPQLVGAGICAPDLLVGSAPGAVAAASRALVALACRTSPGAVHVSVSSAGPSAGAMVDWTRSSIRGRAAADMLTRDQRDRIDRQLSLGWPPGPLALASAAARCAEAAWFGSRLPQPAWVVDRPLTGRQSAATAGAARPDVAAVADVVFAPGGRLRPAEGPA